MRGAKGKGERDSKKWRKMKKKKNSSGPTNTYVARTEKGTKQTTTLPRDVVDKKLKYGSKASRLPRKPTPSCFV